MTLHSRLWGQAFIDRCWTSLSVIVTVCFSVSGAWRNNLTIGTFQWSNMKLIDIPRQIPKRPWQVVLCVPRTQSITVVLVLTTVFRRTTFGPTEAGALEFSLTIEISVWSGCCSVVAVTVGTLAQMLLLVTNQFPNKCQVLLHEQHGHLLNQRHSFSLRTSDQTKIHPTIIAFVQSRCPCLGRCGADILMI